VLPLLVPAVEFVVLPEVVPELVVLPDVEEVVIVAGSTPPVVIVPALDDSTSFGLGLFFRHAGTSIAAAIRKAKV
jgi:hypothetical protein